MKDEDFKGSQPLLFGEDFGEKAKAKIETAAALKKSSTLWETKEKKRFSQGPPSTKQLGPPGWQAQCYGPVKERNRHKEHPR